jgi:hypothetical protein
LSVGPHLVVEPLFELHRQVLEPCRYAAAVGIVAIVVNSATVAVVERARTTIGRACNLTRHVAPVRVGGTSIVDEKPVTHDGEGGGRGSGGGVGLGKCDLTHG